MELSQLVNDIAVAIKRIDARGPQAANARTGALYQPGIGPHPETQAVALIVSELQQLFSERYSGFVQTNISYPQGRQEMRSMHRYLAIVGLGDRDQNAQADGRQRKAERQHADAHPFALSQRSEILPFTDCLKLLESGLSGRKAVVIYGFDYPNLPMDPATEAFETLANRRVTLGPRHVARMTTSCIQCTSRAVSLAGNSVRLPPPTLRVPRESG